MSLESILHVASENRVVHEEITPEVIADNLPKLRQLIAFWRVYPDKFVDYLCSLNPNNSFKFYFYQRVK